MEAARPVSPLNGSYHKEGTVAPFLLDGSAYYQSPSCDRRKPEAHVRQGLRCFGAKETQPMFFNLIFVRSNPDKIILKNR